MISLDTLQTVIILLYAHPQVT